MTTCVEVKNGEGLKVGWDTARRGKRGNVLSSGKCFLGKCLHGKCFLEKYFYGKCLWMVLVIFWMDCMIRSYCWITPKYQQKCLTIFNVHFTLWRACIVMCSNSKVPLNYGQHCGMVWRSFCLRMRIFLETIWTLDLLLFGHKWWWNDLPMKEEKSRIQHNSSLGSELGRWWWNPNQGLIEIPGNNFGW